MPLQVGHLHEGLVNQARGPRRSGTDLGAIICGACTGGAAGSRACASWLAQMRRAALWPADVRCTCMHAEGAHLDVDGAVGCLKLHAHVRVCGTHHAPPVAPAGSAPVLGSAERCRRTDPLGLRTAPGHGPSCLRLAAQACDSCSGTAARGCLAPGGARPRCPGSRCGRALGSAPASEAGCLGPVPGQQGRSPVGPPRHLDDGARQLVPVRPHKGAPRRGLRTPVAPAGHGSVCAGAGEHRWVARRRRPATHGGVIRCGPQQQASVGMGAQLGVPCCGPCPADGTAARAAFCARQSSAAGVKGTACRASWSVPCYQQLASHAGCIR